MAEKTKADVIPAADASKVDAAPDRVAALESQLAELRALLLAQRATPPMAENFRVVQVQDQKSMDEQKLFRARVERGNAAITQDTADEMFPTGTKTFLCELQDGNRHPKVRIRADHEVDAKGRYLAVCGVKSTDKPVVVTPVANAA